MHDDQIAIGLETAKALIAMQFPQFAGQDVVALATAGTVNAIFRIGDQYAARFPLRAMDAGECLSLLQAEVSASREFHACCPFASPNPIGIGRPGDGYPLPFLIQTWVEGEPATPAGQSTSADFARDLARLVATLRTVDLKGRHFDGRGRGGNLRDHDAWINLCFERSEGLIDVPRLMRLWASLRTLPKLGHEVMSHKDLIPANLLVKRDRLVGVIDTGGFGPADPALDLVAAWHLLSRESRRIFRQTLAIGDLEWRRGAAWAFQQAMGLVWYYRTTNPTMAALGESTIARLLEDEETLTASSLL